jgi:two-component system chemotaxis response regulator CheB
MFTQAAAEANKKAAVTCVSGGDEVAEKIKRSDYDVVIVDAEISGPDITNLLKEINKAIPKALILITARPSHAKSKFYEELPANIATDKMVKPLYDSYRDNIDIIKRKLEDIFKTLQDENENSKKAAPIKTEPPKIKKTLVKNKFQPEIVLIAASTGGPLALEKILTRLRVDFPVPILVVQHMPSHFTETLAQNLNHKSLLKIKLGEHRETVSPGTVYIAPGGVHMKLDSKNRIYLDASPPLNGVRPAADALFESVAESFGGTGILSVILTGMGRDGEKGLSKLKEKRDCFCIAQSERTCVVYGMPHAAVESGFADKILDLDEISGELESFAFPSGKKTKAEN